VNRDLGFFSGKKRCPVCEGENEVRMTAVGGGGKGMLALECRCGSCHYVHKLMYESFILFFGGMILPAVFLFPFMGIWGSSGLFFLFLMIVMILFPIFLMALFIHGKIFEAHIEKRIVKLSGKQ